MAAALMELPGIKLVPTESEILAYLRSIIHGEIQFQPTAASGDIGLVAGMIHNCNVYTTQPWNLPRVQQFTHSVGTEAYYFTLRQKKHGSGMRADRRASAGSWKASRTAKDVIDEKDRSAVLGQSMLLCYMASGAKHSSGWVMDEYRLCPDPRFPEYENWAICRVKLNATTEKSTFKRERLAR